MELWCCPIAHQHCPRGVPTEPQNGPAWRGTSPSPLGTPGDNVPAQAESSQSSWARNASRAGALEWHPKPLWQHRARQGCQDLPGPAQSSRTNPAFQDQPDLPGHSPAPGKGAGAETQPEIFPAASLAELKGPDCRFGEIPLAAAGPQCRAGTREHFEVQRCTFGFLSRIGHT